MTIASGPSFATRLRNAYARRSEAARTMATHDITRRWAAALMDQAGLTAPDIVRGFISLGRAGLPPAAAQDVIKRSVQDAAHAFRAGLITHGTNAATDSENTDTGRIQRI